MSDRAAAIRPLLGTVLDAQRDVAEAAAEAVARLLASVSLRDLGAFDRAMRARAGYASITRWDHLTPRDLGTLTALRAGASLVQLALCHPSGFVREAAIRLSPPHANRAELATLLLRTNDWVMQVRTAAHAAIRARLTAPQLPELIAVLPVIDSMRAWHRVRASTLVDELDVVVSSQEARPALLAATSSVDRFLRRSAFRRLIGEAVRLDPAGGSTTADHALYEAALRDSDPALRIWVARALVAAPPELFLAFSNRLLRQRAGSIRFATIQRLVDLEQPWPWRSHVMDAHTGVRAFAQQASLDEDLDPASPYRAESFIADSFHLGTSLLGLGETAGAAEASLVYPHLASSRPGVRRSALLALAAFDVDDLHSHALKALADSSHSVVTTAREVLVERAARLRAEEVITELSTLTTPWGRRAAIAVLAALEYWTGLLHLLRVHAAGSAFDQQQATFHLVRRLAREVRVFTRPSPAIAAALRDMLVRSDLDPSWRAHLEGLLRDRLDPR